MTSPPPIESRSDAATADSQGFLGSVDAALAVAVIAVLVRCWMMVRTHSTTEDFYITLRYAENIAAGRGFVYNPGQHVLGTTTPLYTILLAVAAGLHLDPLVFGKLLNITAEGVTCFLLARLLARKEIGHPVAGLFAALLYAFGSTPISISIGGMETGLVTCVCLGMITAYVAGASRPLYVLGALLSLLRIDGLLLFALLAIALAMRQRRIAWGDPVRAAAIVAPWLLFATLYFGSPVPTSFIAKVYVYSHAMATPRHVIAAAFRTQFAQGWTQMLLTLLFIIEAIVLCRSALYRARQPATPDSHTHLISALAVPTLWLAIYYATMYASSVPPFPWYFLPPWPIFLALAALGGAHIVSWLNALAPNAHARHPEAFAMGFLLLVALFGARHLSAIEGAIKEQQHVEDSLRIPLGLWFRAEAKAGDAILLEPIGYVGYFSQHRILDMIGLVSPEVFASYRTPAPLADMISRFKPAWLCLRQAEAAAVSHADSQMLIRDYTFVREFHVPGRPPDFLIFHRLVPGSGVSAAP